MKTISILESPYAGDIKKNLEYARACMRDMIMLGESPYASHLLYTQPGVLDDDIQAERDLGIKAGFAFKHATGAVTVFYTDLGWSEGMKLAKAYCEDHNLPYICRSPPNNKIPHYLLSFACIIIRKNKNKPNEIIYARK